MATPFATVADVEARWRPLTSAEQTVAETLVGDASTLIRAEFPGIDAQVSSGALDGDVLTIVAANMVKRALMTPAEGVSQESETTGPYSHSLSYANPMRNVFLTEADRVLILGHRPSAMSGDFGNDTATAAVSYQIVYGW